MIIPGEWAPHRAIWTCWPSAADLWEDDLEPARGEVAAMVRALAATTPAGRRGDRMIVLAATAEAVASAKAALAGSADVLEVPFGDIWLRDTGPIFGVERGRLVANRFVFNGWGEKYELPGDLTVGDAVAGASGGLVRHHPFVLEGGAVDHDGEGTVLTTRQCLLNPNRNPGWDQAKAASALGAALGARKILWLGDGLMNDHTDGHVDNIARFIAPGVVACQAPYGDDDPNREVLEQIATDLGAMTDAAGRNLRVVLIPSPGLVLDDEDEPLPASHMNFIIGNATVVMPHYGTASADAAARALAAALPGHRVSAIPSSAVLTGGGSFHCITQQEPAVS